MQKLEYKIQNFIQGLNTEIAPDILGQSFSPDLKNVQFSEQGVMSRIFGSKEWASLSSSVDITKIIKWFKRNGEKYVVALAGDTFYLIDANDPTVITSKTPLSGNNLTDITIFNDILYVSAQFGVAYRYNGSDLVVASSPYGASVEVQGGASGFKYSGYNYYAVTYYTKNTETARSESMFTHVPNAYSQVKVNLPIADSGLAIIGRRIYRANSGSSWEFRLVGTVANNTDTEFIDNGTDANNGAVAPSDIGLFPSAKFIEQYAGRLWLGNTSEGSNYVYYSVLGVPEIPMDYAIDMGDEITGMISFGDALIVATRSDVSRIMLDSTGTPIASSILTGYGAVENTLAIRNNKLYFSNELGVWEYSGATLRIASDQPANTVVRDLPRLPSEGVRTLAKTVQPKVNKWAVDTQADFDAGTYSGTAGSGNGDVILARSQAIDQDYYTTPDNSSGSDVTMAVKFTSSATYVGKAILGQVKVMVKLEGSNGVPNLDVYLYNHDATNDRPDSKLVDANGNDVHISIDTSTLQSGVWTEISADFSDLNYLLDVGTTYWIVFDLGVQTTTDYFAYEWETMSDSVIRYAYATVANPGPSDWTTADDKIQSQIYVAVYNHSGYYYSIQKQITNLGRWGQIYYSYYYMNHYTYLEYFAVKFSQDGSTWTDWISIANGQDLGNLGYNDYDYIQFQVQLVSEDDYPPGAPIHRAYTPVLSQVSVYYVLNTDEDGQVAFAGEVDGEYWLSKEYTDGTVFTLIYDRYNRWTKRDEVFHSYVMLDGKYYGAYGKKIYKLKTGNTFKALTDGTGGTPISSYYYTPKLDFGSPDNIKQIQTIYIQYKGNATDDPVVSYDYPRHLNIYIYKDNDPNPIPLNVPIGDELDIYRLSCPQETQGRRFQVKFENAEGIFFEIHSITFEYFVKPKSVFNPSSKFTDSDNEPLIKSLVWTTETDFESKGLINNTEVKVDPTGYLYLEKSTTNGQNADIYQNVVNIINTKYGTFMLYNDSKDPVSDTYIYKYDEDTNKWVLWFNFAGKYVFSADLQAQYFPPIPILDKYRHTTALSIKNDKLVVYMDAETDISTSASYNLIYYIEASAVQQDTMLYGTTIGSPDPDVSSAWYPSDTNKQAKAYLFGWGGSRPVINGNGRIIAGGSGYVYLMGGTSGKRIIGINKNNLVRALTYKGKLYVSSGDGVLAIYNLGDNSLLPEQTLGSVQSTTVFSRVFQYGDKVYWYVTPQTLYEVYPDVGLIRNDIVIRENENNYPDLIIDREGVWWRKEMNSIYRYDLETNARIDDYDYYTFVADPYGVQNILGFSDPIFPDWINYNEYPVRVFLQNGVFLYTEYDSTPGHNIYKLPEEVEYPLRLDWFPREDLPTGTKVIFSISTDGGTTWAALGDANGTPRVNDISGQFTYDGTNPIQIKVELDPSSNLILTPTVDEFRIYYLSK